MIWELCGLPGSSFYLQEHSVLFSHNLIMVKQPAYLSFLKTSENTSPSTLTLVIKKKKKLLSEAEHKRCGRAYSAIL